MTPLRFACPVCRSALESRSDSLLICPDDQREYPLREGIWRLLPEDRAKHFETFIDQYGRIRRAEGRGVPDPSYFRELPFEDRTGRFQSDWKIRARSYDTLVKRILRPMELERWTPLDVLDIGAGNGWLAYRVARRGHRAIALDLRDDPLDGLGAHVHYDVSFTSVQAEFDALPFLDHQLDLVVFNASLHYATDYRTTLREGLRVLKQSGRLVVMDSPVYSERTAGEEMVSEREVEFERRYGFPSNALPFEHFLTPARLDGLGRRLDLTWNAHHPWYGLRWALRPWRARLRGRREPARFAVLVGRRRGSRRGG